MSSKGEGTEEAATPCSHHYVRESNQRFPAVDPSEVMIWVLQSVLIGKSRFVKGLATSRRKLAPEKRSDNRDNCRLGVAQQSGLFANEPKT